MGQAKNTMHQLNEAPRTHPDLERGTAAKKMQDNKMYHKMYTKLQDTPKKAGRVLQSKCH